MKCQTTIYFYQLCPIFASFSLSRLHYNVYSTGLVATSFLRFYAVPVLGPWVLKLSGTGPGLSLSKKGKKIETRLDF